MVGVAQLVECWIVAPVVAGSNPVAHPILYSAFFSQKALQTIYDKNKLNSNFT